MSTTEKLLPGTKNWWHSSKIPYNTNRTKTKEINSFLAVIANRKKNERKKKEKT